MAMAENLIYGKNLAEFGAVGDGSHDDTEAFEKAFASGETLLVLPCGSYRVTRPLPLTHPLSLKVHPHADVSFAGMVCTGVPSFALSGGRWNAENADAAFSFTACQSVLLSDALIRSVHGTGIRLADTEDVYLENLRFAESSAADGVTLAGEVSALTVTGASFDGIAAAIRLTEGAKAADVTLENMTVRNVKAVLCAESASLTGLRARRIDADVTEDAFAFTACDLTDLRLRHLNLCDGYLVLNGNRVDGLCVSHLVRTPENERRPEKPTLTVSGESDAVILDGIPLDAVILSKKSVPDVRITAARMASPSAASFRYTQELTLTAKNTFILPYGGFEELKIN